MDKTQEYFHPTNGQFGFGITKEEWMKTMLMCSLISNPSFNLTDKSLENELNRLIKIIKTS